MGDGGGGGAGGAGGGGRWEEGILHHMDEYFTNPLPSNFNDQQKRENG